MYTREKERGVSYNLLDFTRRELACDLRTHEEGGNGDCLFHSVGANLAAMLRSNNEAARRHIQGFGVARSFAIDKNSVVASLRGQAANGLTGKTPETVLSYLYSCAIRELHNPQAWHDEWSPIQLLEAHGFEDMLDCESIEAFGDHPAEVAELGGMPGVDALMSAKRDGQTQTFVIRDGLLGIERLKIDLGDQIRIPGNYHWGDHNDICNLCEQLDIGILVFCNELLYDTKRNRRCIYNIGTERVHFSWWIAVWWDNAGHFRPAQLSFSAADEPARWGTFWSDADLPASLRHEFEASNRLAN